MIIKVDNRENKLLDKIQNLIISEPLFKDIEVKSEVLQIGDIIIFDKEEDKLIIERKTVNDLLSSIKDKRYQEQSLRLNGLNHHNHNIIYLIEGNINKSKEKQTVYSAMFSLNYYKGFSICKSDSLDETAYIICNMAIKFKKESLKKAFYNNNELITNNSEKDYISVIKKVKKENITEDNIGEIMLCQIPGISSITAIAIMKKYNNLPNLIKELELNNCCLNDISYTNAKEKTRKINKTSIANIVKFLSKK